MIICKTHILPLLLLLAISVLAASCGDVNRDESIYPLKERAALEVEWTCPETSQTDVSTAAVIKIKFKKELDPFSVTSSALMLGSGRYHVKGNVFYEDRVLTYVPIDELYPDSRYDVYFTSGLRDIDGFAITDNFLVFSFMTGNPGNKTCR